MQLAHPQMISGSVSNECADPHTTQGGSIAPSDEPAVAMALATAGPPDGGAGAISLRQFGQ